MAKGPKKSKSQNATGGNEGSGLTYQLRGPQVEPESSLWLDNVTHIRVPSLDMIKVFSERTPTGEDDRLAVEFAKDFPFDPDSPATDRLDRELALLVEMQEDRPNAPYPGGESFGSEPDARLTITPLSRFIHLQPIPFGTITDIGEREQTRVRNVLEQHLRILDGPRVVNEPRELARIFENETPGLYHRQALNWAFYNRPDVSPVRHARAWMALDVTIYAALSAAWHYKWLRERYSRLLRPREYDLAREDRLQVLFDRAVNRLGQDPGAERDCPEPSPGTPRHPAWPSGHSTYSAAASHILEYFFSPESLEEPDEDLLEDFPAGSDNVSEPRWIAAELRRLANNIGEARLWAGVHWLSDHIAGQKIGRSAAQAVIEQLKLDCVPDFMLTECNSTDEPPDNATIAARAMRGGDCPDNQDKIEQPDERGGRFIQSFGVF